MFERTREAIAQYLKVKEKARSVPPFTFRIVDAKDSKIGHLAPWEIERIEPLAGETSLKAAERQVKAAMGVK